jgi:hypothetical protein
MNRATSKPNSKGDSSMKKVFVLAAIGALMAGVLGPAWAHHSHSMFDETQESSITGTIRNVAWVNPHGYVFLVARNADGTTTTYQIEMSYLQNMIRHGIMPTTFKEGDTYTIKFNPLRDRAPGGSFTGAIDTNGREYNLR